MIYWQGTSVNLGALEYRPDKDSFFKDLVEMMPTALGMIKNPSKELIEWAFKHGKAPAILQKMKLGWFKPEYLLDTLEGLYNKDKRYRGYILGLYFGAHRHSSIFDVYKSPDMGDLINRIVKDYPIGLLLLNIDITEFDDEIIKKAFDELFVVLEGFTKNGWYGNIVDRALTKFMGRRIYYGAVGYSDKLSIHNIEPYNFGWRSERDQKIDNAFMISLRRFGEEQSSAFELAYKLK